MFRTAFSRLVSTAAHDTSDILIVGGGPSGLALASALVSKQAIKNSLRITLVEAADLQRVSNWHPPTSEYSNRVSSLTNASLDFLKDIGAWNHVELGRTCPVDEMQVWDGISDARINFSAPELGLQDGMARLTENINLQRGLLQFLQQHPSVQILDKTKVQSILPDDNGHWPLVHLDNSRVIRTRLLIGADGFNSPVRSYANISSFGWSYDTQAIVATMFHPQRVASPLNPSLSNTTAFQRFLPTGPIAFLPLSPTASSLVWSTKPPLATALLAAGPSVLSQMISAAFRLPEVSMRYLHNRILDHSASGKPITAEQIREEISWRERSHNINIHSAYSSSANPESVGIPPIDAELLPPMVSSIQEGTMASFPLRFNHTDAYIGEGERGRTVLVGDAAHTVHPLAGQGLNLGLGDAECLARCIDNAIRTGGDIGSYTSLFPYAQERYFENHKIMSVMDKLHKLYTTTAEPIVWARSLGLEIVNELDFVKTAIMMTAGAKKAGEDSTLPASFFNLAASGIRSATSASQAMGLFGDTAKAALSRGLGELMKNWNAKSDSNIGPKSH